jgi:hypothetical protein
MGAEVLNLSIRTSINICGLLNICASISPTSPSPRPLAVIHMEKKRTLKTIESIFISWIILYYFFWKDEPKENTFSTIQNINTKNYLEQKVIDSVSKIISQKQNEGSLIDKNQKTNQFRNKISKDLIDEKLSKVLNGEWIIKKGNIRILQSRIEEGRRVVFKNENGEQYCGWGTIFYNKKAKFYFTEAGSNLYDYYVSKYKELVLMQYEYYDENVNFRDKPKVLTDKIKIEKISEKELKLKYNENEIILIKNEK